MNHHNLLVTVFTVLHIFSCDADPIQIVNAVILAELGEPCATDADCSTEHSICMDEICTCQANYIEAQNKCLKAADQLGEPCEVDQQCTFNLGDLSTCFTQGICICKTNGIPSSGRDKCLPVLQKLGDICEESIQCQQGTPGNYSECLENPQNPEVKICGCSDIAVPQNSTNKCLPKASKIGDPCEISEQCTESLGDLSECYSNSWEPKYCKCKAGSTGNPEGTQCVRGYIGRLCQEDAGCPTNSRCLPFGVCTCGTSNSPRGFITSANLEECLPVATFGGACKESQQCQQGMAGSLSFCGTNSAGKMTCRCNDAAAAVETGLTSNAKTECYAAAKYVGDNCDFTEQCLKYLERSHCLHGKCVCLPGTVASSGSTTCVQQMPT